jgi:TonB family protein
MKFTKEELYGFGGSTVLCLLILLLLRFVFLQMEVRAEAEGIPVEFGTVEWASGTIAPASSGREMQNPDVMPVPEVIPNPAPPSPLPPIITQTAEQTVAIEAERQRKEQEQRAEQERREAERNRLEEEQRRKDAINRQMADAFGAGNATGGSKGTNASGSGSRGNPQGNASTGAPTGIGGIGTFDLSGRALRSGSLPRPAYDFQEEGTIVVEITVNPQGDVIQVTLLPRGTNISNAIMRRAAIDAAKKAKFNSIGGSQNQIGTITYRYNLK